MNSISNQFKNMCIKENDRSEGVVAIKLLTKLIEESKVSTVQELRDLLSNAIEEMLITDTSNSSVKSSSELFLRFISLTIADCTGDFEDLRKRLLTRAAIYLNKVDQCREQIARHTLSILYDGIRVMVHAKSRVILAALECAVIQAHRRNIHCYVTMASPGNEGQSMYQLLTKRGISCSLIPDTAIAYVMPETDAVLLGAEAVVESGGILNRLGSSTLAMVAHSFGKPVYVLAESFKFVRSYPLDQRHIADEFKWPPAKLKLLLSKQVNSEQSKPVVESSNNFAELDSVWERLKKLRANKSLTEIPITDYTNPKYITQLISDLGILTPSAVSDELIKLYL
ncbi:Translation initiation factor [Cichlidogyrus casuarinus]|uniref:Translation initiation factor eIF2B subunit alpha n=1 Tax=Cichlidogyrus casuarinus TaxID=1844966 RepID=A0ABD2QMN7_9PLAT